MFLYPAKEWRRKHGGVTSSQAKIWKLLLIFLMILMKNTENKWIKWLQASQKIKGAIRNKDGGREKQWLEIWDNGECRCIQERVHSFVAHRIQSCISWLQHLCRGKSNDASSELYCHHTAHQPFSSPLPCHDDNDVDEIGYVMIEQFISLCESFNPPNNAVSFAAHFEKGDELSMGLAQDVAVLGELVVSDAEGGHAPVQVHLHPQLIPLRQLNTCFCAFVPIVAIVYATITKTTTKVAHCIPWIAGLSFLSLSESVDHSNYHAPIHVGDAGIQDKGPCPSQHHPQQHLIKTTITLSVVGDVAGLDEESGSMGSLQVY